MGTLINERLRDSVIAHEGFRARAYKDSVGVWTIGYGTNLQELEITQKLAEEWLDRKLVEAQTYAKRQPEWDILSQPRRDVIVEMIYNLGPRGYSSFVNTRKAMLEGRWEDAAEGMLASKWATQVGKRAARLAGQMRTGEYWLADYDSNVD